MEEQRECVWKRKGDDEEVEGKKEFVVSCSRNRGRS